MKVFVLNCKHNKKRRDRIKGYLNNENLDYTIHTALYWKDNDFDENISKNGMSIYKNWSPHNFTPLPDNVEFDEWYNRGIKKGEAAVCASSILMLEEMLKTGDEHILALQDDACWEDGVLSQIIDLVEHDIAKYPLIRKADLLWLSGWNVDYRGDDLEYGNVNWAIPRFTYNAHAMVYSRKGIEKILNSGIKNTLMSYDEYLNVLSRQSYRDDIIKDINPEPFYSYKLKNSDKLIWQECALGIEDDAVSVPWKDGYGGYSSDILTSDEYD